MVLSEDVTEVRRWATRIAVRYTGVERMDIAGLTR